MLGFRLGVRASGVLSGFRSTDASMPQLAKDRLANTLRVT